MVNYASAMVNCLQKLPFRRAFVIMPFAASNYSSSPGTAKRPRLLKTFQETSYEQSKTTNYRSPGADVSADTLIQHPRLCTRHCDCQGVDAYPPATRRPG